jgi:hypothetical protein
MPNVDQVIDRINGKYKGSYDFDDAYHQCAMAEGSKPLTALIFEGGKQEFNFMEYGLVGAGFHWQKWMDVMLSEDLGIGPAKGKFADAVIDDVALWANTIEDYRRYNKDLLDRFEKWNLRIKIQKAKWLVPEILFCGRLLTPDGVKVGPPKAEALFNLRDPKCKSDVETLVGLCEWHMSFVKNFFSIMEPIYRVRKSSGPGKPFVWSKECRDAYLKICQEIQASCARSQSGPGVMHIYVDAGNPKPESTVAFQLVREYEGKTFLMSYGGKKLSEVEQRWDMPRKELFAIYTAIKKMFILMQNHGVI